MAVFWIVAPCSLVEVYQHFRGPCCLHDQDLIALMMEAARTSETLVNYQTTRHYNPEDSHLCISEIPRIGLSCTVHSQTFCYLNVVPLH
jgi:hypothetical protein